MNEDLTPVERSWLDSLRRHLSNRDSWLMGTYAEHVVADALPGAQQSISTFAAWDLDWERISIEVKCSTERQTGVVAADKPSAEKWDVRPHYAWDHEAQDWHPGDKKRWAGVYVLARHEGFDHRTGWSFYVVPGRWFDDRATITITGSLLRAAGWGPHAAAALPDAVREAERLQVAGNGEARAATDPSALNFGGLDRSL